MYDTPRELPVVFHNGSSYDHHFIVKGLAEEFEGDFECLGGNKEKYIAFSVPIKIESNNDQTIIYRMKFTDSFRFMPTSLSTLVDNYQVEFLININVIVVDVILNTLEERRVVSYSLNALIVKENLLKSLMKT